MSKPTASYIGMMGFDAVQHYALGRHWLWLDLHHDGKEPQHSHPVIFWAKRVCRPVLSVQGCRGRVDASSVVEEPSSTPRRSVCL